MLARMKEHKHASQQQANSQQQTTNATTTTPTSSSNNTSPAAATSSLNSPSATSSTPQNSSPVIVGNGNGNILQTSSTTTPLTSGVGLQNYADDNYSKKRSYQEMEQSSSSYSRNNDDDSSKFNKSSHPSNPSNLHHYDENNDEDEEDLAPSSTIYNNQPPTYQQQGSSSSSTPSAHPSYSNSSSNNRPVAPPSKVLLFSNLPPNCQKSELLEFDSFNECKFQKVFLFKQPAPSGPNRHNKKRKRDGYLAFVEFESVEKAQMFLDKFEGQKIKIRNRTAYLKFSEKQQLEGTPGGLTMNVNEDLNTVPVNKTVVNTNNATIIHITFTHCDEYNYPLNVDLLFNLFSKFGTIEKINIFIKNELTQSLVQFKTDTEATEAVKEMEGVFVYPDMKLYRMNIQFSKKSREELLIKETNHRNRDYNIHPMRSQKPYESSSMRYTGTPSNNNNNHYAPPPLDDPYYVSESSNSNSPDRRVPPSGNDMDEMMLNRRKSPPPYMSARDSYPPHHFAQPSYNNYPPPSSYYPPPSSSSNGAMMIPPSSMHSYNGPNDYMGSSAGFPPMGGPPPMPPQHHGVPPPHHGHPQQFPPSYSSNGVPPPMHMPMFPPGTCVVIVKNLPVQCTCDHLFVLFGLYGDVIKVSISLSKKDHKTPYMAFIQFKYPHEVGNALRFLGAPFYPTFNKYTPGNTPISSGSTLFGKELHIEPSFRIFDIIPPRSSKSKENDGSKDILFRSYENSPLHRFTPRQGTQESYQANMKKLMNICPPSPVLHISNVSGTTTEDKIRREIDKLFESPNQRKQKSRIVDFKFIDYKKTQTSDHKMKEKKSAIIEMDSIDAATTVLVELHDISIDSHHLNIKFSNRSGSQSSSQSHYDSYYQNDQRSNNSRPPRRSTDRMPQQDTMMGENQDN